MTLEKILMAWEDGEVTLQQTEDAILSWFKEQLPKDMEYKRNQSDYICGVTDGYNQCLQTILTNLTAKQGER